MVEVLPARVVTLWCFDHEDEIHRAITALSHEDILKQFVSLEHANLRFLYSSILVDGVVDLVLSCVDRDKSRLANGLRLDNLNE